MEKFDFHVHVTNQDTDVEKSIRYFNEMCERKHLTGVCIHAVEYTSKVEYKDCNEKAMAVSRGIPNSFAFAGLHHAQDFVEQTKRYMEQGFKGIKLLEGKPSLYRYYGYGFSHPRFEPFFSYVEENAIPLLIHNNDPLLHWDIHRISRSAFDKGWYYDSTMPNQEYFFTVLDDIFEKFPRLHAAIAHFGFYSNDIKRASRLLDKYPNLMMDMTPALIIFDELSETPDETKAFLYKYSNRLIYGTDVSNRIEGNVREFNDTKTELMQAFYEGTGEYVKGNHRVCGMNMDENILKGIYSENALRFIGASVK